MGTNKALLPFGGETLVERQIRLMRPLCPHILLITNQPSDYRDVMLDGVEFVPDRFPDHGPVSGLHAALSRCDDMAWAVGCDQPFLSAAAARLMRDIAYAERWGAVIPVVEGRPQMLHGIYAPACAEPLAQLIGMQQYRLTGLLDRIRWKAVDEAFFEERGVSADFSFDMDTPEAYRHGLQAAGFAHDPE